ncbi:MAG: AI-2E family transporter, partial [Myxococcota bacterium]
RVDRGGGPRGSLYGKRNGGEGLLNHPSVIWVRDTILPYLNLEKVDIQGPLLSALRNLSANALGWSTAILQNLVRMVFSLFIMLFTLYYVFKDGGAASQYVQNIHPMVRQTRIIRTMEELTFTTFYAGFVTAAVQGLLAGTAFAVLGVPSAFFWGTMTALMSFVPMVGATSIWLPVVIWFVIQGSMAKAIGLALWGVGVVSVADNLIKPALISGRMNLHPLLVFFSVLGGLGFFGALGIILGPLVLVLSLALLDAIANASRSTGA